MPSDNKIHSPLAVGYAQSLLDLAIEANVAQSVGDELASVASMLQHEPTLLAFFENPAIETSQRQKAIESAFKSSVSPLMYQFLQVANQRDALGNLGEISDAYSDFLMKHLGNIEVDVTVARPLSEAELEQVRQRVGNAFGKQAAVSQHVDESIIGGMILRIGDRIIDGSVSAQLQAMRQRLTAAV